MRILVITSCTGRKKYKHENQLKYEDFTSSECLRKRTKELKDFNAPAAEMYTGQQHRHLMCGLRQLRETNGQNVADLYIISAGYGLLSENDVIVPYNVTWQRLKKKEILERSNNLKIHESVETLIANYELVFFLLGKEYVQALQLPFNISATVTQIFLSAPSWQNIFSKHLQKIHVVSTGVKVVDQFDSATRYNLKGFVFERLCEAACRDGFQVFEEVKKNPQLLLDIIQNS